MAMQPGQYQAHYGSNKEKAERPEEPNNLYRHDGTRSQPMMSEPPYPSSQDIPYDTSAIPQSLRHLIFTKADGGLRISDISLQTGEEFALGFSQEASRAQRELASRRNVSNADWTSPHATYADSRDILGFRRMDSGAKSDKSYKGGGGEVDGNSGSLYGEPTQDMQITLSFKATVDQKSDGGFAAYSAKPMKYSQMSRSSSRRSSFSEASRGSSVKKIKLMCSFGGKFLPRPKDGKLRYVGGDTHIISITKDISYDSLVQKISDIYGQGFILKYQLPGEELDSLVSVSCDEDLENMMDEFEKMEEQNGSCKLRIFLFDSYDHDMVHYNVLADRRNSEQLYVDAVNRIAQSSLRKQSGSIGSLTGQHSGNLIGLDFAEEVSGKKTNECFPELSFYQSTSDVQSVPVALTSQTLLENPVMSNIHYVSQAPIISSPFLSMPSSVEHIESVDAPHMFPERGVKPDFQSCNVSSTLQDNHFKSYEHPLHEMMHEVTDFGASEEQLGNHTEAFNPNFSISSSHNWRDFDTVFSSYPPHEVQMPQVYDPRQYGMHTIAGDHVSDWMFVSQALHQVHRHTDRQYADVNQYGILQHDYSLSNYEDPKIAPSLSHVAQSFHYEQPHSTYFESTDGSSNYMVQQSCNNTLEDLQSDRSAGKINSVNDTYNHKNSSPPPNIPSDGSEAKEQNDINVSKNNQELCKPTEQSEMGELREPKENLQFNKAFYPSEMHYPSCQSAEQNLSPKEPAPENKDLNFHNVSEVNTSLIDPQKASQQSSIPHVHSDTVLQTYSKSSGSMNEDIFPSPSHRSESSLTVISSDRRPDLSEDQTLCMQSIKDIGNETSSTGCINNINHTTFSEQLPGHVSHQSGESSQDPSGLESHCEDSDGFNQYLQQKAFVQNHKATRTRMCQSEGDEDEKVSDLVGDSYGNRSISFNSFNRGKFSETLYTFLPLNLDETFQAYSKVKNLERPSEDAERKDFPNHGTRNTENQSTDDIEEQLADSLSHSPSRKQGVASSENLTEIVDRDNKGHVDESHAVSFGSETWWTKAKSVSMDCKVDSSHFDLGKTESLDPSSLTTDNEMDKALYHATPSFVKNLMDDDIVEAYDKEEDLPLSYLLSRSLMEETSDGICSNGFSTKLKVTEDAFANTDIHDNLDSASKDHFLGSGEDKAGIVIPSLKIDSALTTEREWEVVSTSATAGSEMLQGTAMEAVEEESVAAQYFDTEENKIEDSDKDEPYCDAAIEEATKRGLQVIKNADLEELRELGCGTFGTVFYGKWRGSDVAIKRIKNSCFIGTPSMQGRMRAEFWREACILAQLHHPNVVAFYGVVPDGPGGTLATVTEYMVNGSLKQVLQRRDRSIDRRKRWLITMDAAFGMEYLHSKNIVHFDLKCENLLVNMRDSQRPICKVGDLGLSKVKQHTLVSGGVRGTLPWMAPELLNGSSSMVSEKVDVFSFGIVMWELLTGEEPYANMHYGAIIGGIVSNTLRPHVPNWCDPQWRALMEQCWSADPGVRPTFTEIANRLRSTANSFHPKGHSHTVQMHYG